MAEQLAVVETASQGQHDIDVDFAGADPSASGGVAIAESFEALSVSTSQPAPSSALDFTFPSLAPPSEKQAPPAPLPLTARSTVRDASGPTSTSQPISQAAATPKLSGRVDVKRNKDQCSRALYGFLSRFFPVMLEKGYSQVDWLRLGRTQPDLNGLHGAAPSRSITLAEVALHKTKEDMWMVLRGKVYNVSPYLKFHPGGADVLMKAAGRDGTVLFNKFHPWVNGDALLEKCLVGWLVEGPAAAAKS